MKKISHSYFVVMIDHGQRGLEAVVHPEDTRRKVVEMLASGESKHVVFIHHVEGLFIEDVTDELFEEAEAKLKSEFLERRATQQAYEFDRARSYAKETV